MCIHRVNVQVLGVRCNVVSGICSGKQRVRQLPVLDCANTWFGKTNVNNDVVIIAAIVAIIITNVRIIRCYLFIVICTIKNYYSVAFYLHCSFPPTHFISKRHCYLGVLRINVNYIVISPMFREKARPANTSSNLD